MIHVMLPAQYLREPGGRRIEPQKRLMLAVLQKVVDDCVASRSREGTRGAGQCDRKDYESACAYLKSTDRQWPFTFENLCEALGFDAASLRCELLRETSS